MGAGGFCMYLDDKAYVIWLIKTVFFSVNVNGFKHQLKACGKLAALMIELSDTVSVKNVFYRVYLPH